MTREQLEQSIQTQLPTNGVGLIAAVNTRQVATDIADYIDDEIDEMNSKVPVGMSRFSDYAVFNNQNGDYLFYMYPAEVNPARAGLMTSADKQYLNSLTSTIIPGINEHINGILSTVTNLQNTKQNKLTVNNPIYLTNDILSLRDSSGNQINSIISTASEWVNVQNKTLASVELLKQMMYTKSDVNSILGSYYNKSEIDSTLSNYYTKGETSILLNDYYTKSYVDTNYYNKNQTNTLLNNFYSKDYIDDLASNYYSKLDVDDEPISESQNLVTSGGIYKSTPTVVDSTSESDLDISDELGNVLVRFAEGNIKTKNFDSSELNSKKYVDCIGDSLTMGASWLGWYETNLQELLGQKYIVRNWGVGGETKSTIMARQGSTSVKFSSSFTLPANGTNVTLPLMKSRFDNGNVTPLLQGSTVDSSHTSKMVNPCFISGVECEMTNSGTTYYLKRKNIGDRDLVIDENAPILMNTGKQTKDAFITIVWFGTNGKPTSNEQSDELVSAYERVVTQLPNSNFIFIGLHTLDKTLAEYYENAMFNKFGNKFFNIREYCCSDILYDAGITPTQADLENMANGICPSSALYDSTHFKPVTNACIGRRLYEMIVQLGYINK